MTPVQSSCKKPVWLFQARQLIWGLKKGGFQSRMMERWNRVVGKFVKRYIHSNDQAIKNIYFEYSSVTFRLPFRYIRYLNNSCNSNYQNGNLNHSFYYNCIEKIKIIKLQKINSNNNVLKVVGYLCFKRRLSKKHDINIYNSLQISSGFLKRDSFD